MNKLAYFKLMGLNKIAAQTDNNQIDKLKDSQLLSYAVNHAPSPSFSQSLVLGVPQATAGTIPGFALSDPVPKASRDYYNLLTLGTKLSAPIRNFKAGFRGFFGLDPKLQPPAKKQMPVAQVQKKIKGGLSLYGDTLRDVLKKGIW